MKKVTLIFSLFILLVALSAQAQQLPGIKHPPVITPDPQAGPVIQYDNTITVEDDASGYFLIFNPISGSYKFSRCSEGTAINVMSGTGKVKIDGCSVSLEDVQPSRTVLVSVNKCTQEGKAAIEQFSVKDRPLDILEIKEYLSDSNMRDNTRSCKPKDNQPNK